MLGQLGLRRWEEGRGDVVMRLVSELPCRSVTDNGYVSNGGIGETVQSMCNQYV